ncbi:MAG TPA: Ig domain-containing protein [Bryobacteraceae bacterium]|nr:Ig domain-containing protein [Bryobacteraceae bacterium]
MRLLLALVPAAVALGQITPTTLVDGVINIGYYQQLSCNCQAQWAITAGSLPPGLGIGTDTGLISGVPTAVGTFSFQVSAISTTTYTANLSIVIHPALSLASTSLPNGAVGEYYNEQVSATGGLPPYYFSIVGNLPPGLSLSGNTIQGDPTATGTFSFTLYVSDYTETTVYQALSITINGALAITTTSIPVGFQGVAYPATTINGVGGNPPYLWSLGTVRDGLTINGSTGVLSGTPTSAGQFTLNITLSDSTGGQVVRGFTLNVLQPLKILTSSLPNGTVGTVYPTQTLSGSGGQPPYTWSIPPAMLPPGLTLNAAQGTIAGTPTTVGSYPLTVTLKDSQSNTATANLSISVVGGITISPATLPGGTVGTAYSQALTAAGGQAPYTWSVAAGNPPGGLTLDPASGVLSGTPTAAGTFAFTAQVADATGAIGQMRYSLTIANPPLTVSTTSLPGATVGVAYSQTLAASGGQPPYSWSIVTGTLPAGLTLNATTGVIAGSPTAAGTSNFTVQAADAAQATAQANLSIVVTAALTIGTASLPGGTIGTAYSQTLAASGGTPAYIWSVTSGVLPAGLTLNASSGAITGTPTTAGTSSFTVTVTDAAKNTASKQFSIVVAAPPPPTLTITGAPPTSGFEQQLTITLSIGAAYPLDISGTMTLTFAPSVTPSAGVDDAMIQFSTGGRVVTFTIPAGSTAAKFSGASSVAVLTGTTAGTITLTTVMQDSAGNPLGTTTKTIVDNAGVPFISSVSFQQTTGGIVVTVVGFSSTRDMVSGDFTFAPATNVTFTQPTITVPLTSAFTAWWSNTAQSNPYGTQFALTMPFSTSTPSVSAVSVKVTLTNSKGTSNPVSPSQ